MRKSRALLIMITFLMLALTSCSASQKSNGTADPGEQDKIVLKYHNYAPRASIDEPMVWWAEEVSKRSGVKIEYEFYWAGALAGAEDNLNALSAGAFDVTWISPMLHPGQTPYLAVANSLPLITSDVEAATAACNELATEGPGKTELEKFNVKYLFATAPWQYHLLSTKPINSLNDIKGFKARTFGNLSIVWQKLGGMPVTMTIPEVYSALQSGLIDGNLSMPSGFVSTKGYEIAKHYIPMTGLAVLPSPFLMNMNTWNKLPSNVQAAMLEVAQEMPGHVAEIVESEEAAAIEKLKQNGVKIYEMPPDIEAQFEAIKDEVWKEAGENMNKLGLPGSEVVTTWVELVKKHS